MSTPRIPLAEAVQLVIAREGTPVLTAYGLGRLIFQLFQDGQLDGRPLRIQRQILLKDYAAARRGLLSRKVLVEDNFLPNTIMRVQGHEKIDPREIICLVDPLCYLSHLTAMAHHGLTNRLPRLLFYTSLYGKEWATAAALKMAKDLGEKFDAYKAVGLPLLTKPHIEKLSGTAITQVMKSETMGAYRMVPDSALRVSTIGRTFLDMLRRPELCGGMSHVKEIYQEHGKANAPLIINEVEAYGNKIERVRAGYILEEICQVRDARVDAWTKHAQRGGSRKLDPQAGYSEQFSERWMLSINA